MVLFNNRKPVNTAKSRIAKEYTELTERLAEIRANYEFAVEDDIIDALIYDENAVLARLAALYKEARELDMRLDFYDLPTDRIT